MIFGLRDLDCWSLVAAEWVKEAVNDKPEVLIRSTIKVKDLSISFSPLIQNVSLPSAAANKRLTPEFTGRAFNPNRFNSRAAKQCYWRSG